MTTIGCKNDKKNAINSYDEYLSTYFPKRASKTTSEEKDYFEYGSEVAESALVELALKNQKALIRRAR
jgi:hypothetical protein